jgi:WhiB family transcriptional regulator, redox-sensing transcriptional regulator
VATPFETPAAESWQRDAACRGDSVERFFSSEDEAQQAALELCSGCPVRTPCLRWALSVDEMHGIWGGTTEPQRRAMIRERRREERRRREAEAA